MTRQRLLAPPGADDRMVAPMRWFSRTFGLAVVAHLVGNPAGWRGDEFGGSILLVVVSAVLGVLGLLLLVRPDVRVLAAAAALTVVSLWLELPVTGNHWVLVGLIAVAVLMSLATRDPWAWLSVTGRWLLLGFYSFAAFAKLNTGFLDPTVSCGVFYANQSLSSFGLPTFDGASPMGMVAIAGPVLTELSVADPSGLHPDPTCRSAARAGLPLDHLARPRPALLRLHGRAVRAAVPLPSRVNDVVLRGSGLASVEAAAIARPRRRRGGRHRVVCFLRFFPPWSW